MRGRPAITTRVPLNSRCMPAVCCNLPGSSSKQPTISRAPPASNLAHPLHCGTGRPPKFALDQREDAVSLALQAMSLEPNDCSNAVHAVELLLRTGRFDVALELISETV